jgi:hypothetical protein
VSDPYIANPDNTVQFIRYTPDGRVDMYGMMARGFIEDFIADGQLYLMEEGTLNDHWVLLPQKILMERTESIATLNGMTINDCPVPCQLIIEGVTYGVTNGTAELSFTQPGTYEVTVTSVPCYPKTFQVVVP